MHLVLMEEREAQVFQLYHRHRIDSQSSHIGVGAELLLKLALSERKSRREFPGERLARENNLGGTEVVSKKSTTKSGVEN